MNQRYEKMCNGMKKKEKIIKIGDVIVIGLLLAVSLCIFLCSLPSRSEDVGVAVVTVDGREYGRYPLDTDREIILRQNGYTNIIEIKGGTVRMSSADCPDKSCVSQGQISHGGQVIVCLPARITVTLEGTTGQIDSIAY